MFLILHGLGALTLRVAVAAAVALLALAFFSERLAGRDGLGTRLDDADRAGSDLAALEAVLSALHDPALLLDADDVIIACNRRALELEEKFRVGVHISGAIRNPDFLDALARARQHGGPEIARYAGRVPIARHFETVIACVPAAEQTGRRTRIVATFRDLTEQERINRMRADFVANASHELRTPLAAVLGFVETLQGPARHDTAARERFLVIMAKEANRMKRLIGDLTSLTRVEMHQHVRPRGRIDLNPLLSQVCETLGPIALETTIALSLRPLGEPAIVIGDEDELTQVFQNLANNALRYGRKGGRVDISVERQPHGEGKPQLIAVAITDDGIGIAEEHLHRLTERFYRVDTAASRAAGGTGLGLAIVKHILIRHDSELQIQSKPGAGSTFTVVLPASRAGSESPVERSEKSYNYV